MPAHAKAPRKEHRSDVLDSRKRKSVTSVAVIEPSSEDVSKAKKNKQLSSKNVSQNLNSTAKATSKPEVRNGNIQLKKSTVNAKKSSVEDKKKTVKRKLDTVDKTKEIVNARSKSRKTDSASVSLDSKPPKNTTKLQAQDNSLKKNSASKEKSSTKGRVPKAKPLEKDSPGMKEEQTSKKKNAKSVASVTGKQRKPVGGNENDSKTSKKKNSRVKTADGKQIKDQGEGKHSAPPALDLSDPMAMLMMMEGRSSGGQKPHALLPSASVDKGPSTSTPKVSKDDDVAAMTDSESDGMSDWEDVRDHTIAEEKSQLPDKPVEITLELPDILKQKKRKKKPFDWKAYLQRRVNRFKKEVALDMHKVHLLCLLSVGLQQNEALNDETLTAVALSSLPSQFTENIKLNEERLVENLLLWYKRKFPLDQVQQCSDTRLVPSSTLVQAFSEGKVTDARIWVLVFIALLRTVGLTVRIVLSFQPIPFKVTEAASTKNGKGKQPVSGSKNVKKSSAKANTPKASEGHQSSPAHDTKMSKTSKSRPTASTTKKPESGKMTPKRRPSSRESSKKAIERNRKSLADSDYEESEEEADSELSEEEMKHKQKVKKKRAKLSQSMDKDTGAGPSSDTEFEDNSRYFRTPDSLRKDLKIGSNRKVLSETSADEDSSASRHPMTVGHDFWLEVFFPAKKKWVCFDSFKSQFGKPYSLENCATQPLSYVLGFRNDGSVKDVTARYAKQWLSHTRKMRADQEWWTETLLFFDQANFKENMLEDDEIKGQLLVRPMPTSIAEFKNHPLYALRRHLLKFEAIYPDTAIPCGYIKKEPVYARECVRILHSRDNWLKEGRLVRVNEKAYKMVKSRPKWNKPKENPDELDLELYGEWQTDVYIPPPAYNGKVPKNEYGNVELFKPWMLPKGTVQIRGNGLQRVAKKLSIDVAPAMVGWDHHCGYAHPIMDGWIVCEEFADTLLAAWEEDQEIQKQRELEKLEKRVYGNWKLLIRGLLIKERLKNKFLQEPDSKTSELTKEDKGTGKDIKAEDYQQSWPVNRQQEDSKAKVIKKKKKVERDRKIVEKQEVKDDLDEEIKLEAEEAKVENVLEKKAVVIATKKKHEAGHIFSGVREVVENLNISEDSEDEEEEDNTKVSQDDSKKGAADCKSEDLPSLSLKDKTKSNEKQKNRKTAVANKRGRKKRKESDSDFSSSDEREYHKEVENNREKRGKRLVRSARKKVNYYENEEEGNDEQSEEEEETNKDKDNDSTAAKGVESDDFETDSSEVKSMTELKKKSDEGKEKLQSGKEKKPSRRSRRNR
ncbi:DNA repair protein complementing XP-C cells homolog [Aplysia californica]|uniref:DNA repair protein complementing XP-C cells homolog n=1 Tax=Aplysia californica TaxID=6500 RepID=A0ABM0K637_APLCA|nr:DNA repair protein complementing XP-C cells homolog [Aplysia californica]